MKKKKFIIVLAPVRHGNVIDFLIKVKGYSFKDALHELANKVGVELSYKSSKVNNAIYEVNNFASRFIF